MRPKGASPRYTHLWDLALKGGQITARDLETGVASYGETKTEALHLLAEALELHEGGGEPVTDEDLDAWGVGRCRAWRQ